MTLDPKNWPAFRKTAHAMLDASLDKLEGAREGRVWTPVPKSLKAEINTPLPQGGISEDQMMAELEAIMPYNPGNIHPRFFGWVNGAGAPSNILAEMAGAAMNANCGGRNHVGPVIEQQVIRWAAQIMGMPSETTGLISSGTSMATVTALKVARDKFQRENPEAKLVGYTGAQTHSCVRRAFDLLGIGKDALRLVQCNDDFEINLSALQDAIDKDRAEGFTPFSVIGTVGAVNVGAIDDLDGLADICEKEELWFHVDGAFGAAAILSPSVGHRVKALSRVDSLAFDFHKWWQVNYEAGCVLIRDPYLHRSSYANRPEYLRHDEDGLAGGDFWAVDYGPELSRSFRALKVWTHLKTHGIDAIAEVVERNISQAQYLKRRVEAEDKLELLAPVALNICCFRYDFRYESNAKNARIVVDLQESGLAAPSSTIIDDVTAIRVNLTNHRTQESDLDILVDAVLEMGKELE
ncbi:pyridoxal phosphate-dependent decarboxylase family protein [Hellea balneolensis]|uniref:pyridoxal phosphate-dependent decarboxylase family protein n=1 Tax=Hellea balneolensis TaxID=287478 RepID=UPI0003FA8791|nr:pyridoxal-dependent decarboxylase [Hellea balneolensis]